MEKDETENKKESLKDSESLEPEKKGGPYSKKEQEERKIKVYHLCFEENKSAVEIAELLNVNRNTINDDIKYWHQQLASEFKAQDLTAKMTKQIQRMEIQRDSLLEDLDEVENFDEKIKLERFVSDVDNRLVQLFSKMISSGKSILSPTVKLDEINDDEIKEFVRDLVLENEDPYNGDIHSEDQFKFDFIRKTKCNLKYAGMVVEKMQDLGLSICQAIKPYPNIDYDNIDSTNIDYSQQYDFGKFAYLCGYISPNEYAKGITDRLKLKGELDLLEEKEEKFFQQYGSDQSKWTDEIRNKYHEEIEDPPES